MVNLIWWSLILNLLTILLITLKNIFLLNTVERRKRYDAWIEEEKKKRFGYLHFMGLWTIVSVLTSICAFILIV